jgi:hypothetical protein
LQWWWQEEHYGNERKWEGGREGDGLGGGREVG